MQNKLKASYAKYQLKFITPGGTSRGVLHEKETFFLQIEDEISKGVGECAIFRGLSSDDVPDYEEKLLWLCQNIHLDAVEILSVLEKYPSLIFGYEQAMKNLQERAGIYFPSAFTDNKDSIRINGLIWMGSAEEMQQRILEKLQQGFQCLKLKIGTDWATEYEILKQLRQRFSAEDLELRVDANGAFSYVEAKSVLEQLFQLKVHSIEQPIKAGQTELMAKLCENTPTPIALDEELIGIHSLAERKHLLEQIRPQYIILKPALVGGFSGSDAWIHAAEELGIKYWITSALESNIGLNAIAQYTFLKQNPLPQGLGTGGVFSNNCPSPLELSGEQLYYKGFREEHALEVFLENLDWQK